MVARSSRGWPGTLPVAVCRSAVSAALGGVLQQLDTDPGPHQAGEAAAPGDGDEVEAPDDAVAPGEAPAAVAAARAGSRLVVEQDRPERVDRPRGATAPFQLGEPLPHRADERAFDVGAPVQPFHGPGQQVGIRSRRAGRHGGLTSASRRPGHRASEASVSSRSRSCRSVSVGASSASVITCRSVWRSRPMSSAAAVRSAR